MELLSKTRVINQLLQRSDTMRAEHHELIHTLRDMTAANVFLIDPEGMVLAYAAAETFDLVAPPGESGPNRIPAEYLTKLRREEETLSNIQETTPFCAGSEGPQAYATYIPVMGGSARLGTLMLTRHSSGLTEEDIVLAEYSATVIGYEMSRVNANKLVQEGRDRSVVQMAVDSLSFSELEAVDHILTELNGREGLLVASRIADRVGITRSVIVNALRKLESAGVVEARSLGMKGTHIKILNEKLLPLLENMKSK
ncbi:GTP-sensing pleiotropic transcriptional regulator CodY [Tumebacillus sp. DT12]|uniref:Global transcriptional regulator CodY n=1 Tax=Tumebacillus lacus TaxID=2995335 RepID=A0ABT3WV49_9BACL|nr:GTP-sensing pleiotropic transcriptional regulator CodY [Tumebacillus lacus]MCX7568509.1 GTP-sensing pleiotropic transcriptional regulator CodY [Tumebacillus lacus]